MSTLPIAARKAALGNSWPKPMAFSCARASGETNSSFWGAADGAGERARAGGGREAPARRVGAGAGAGAGARARFGFVTMQTKKDCSVTPLSARRSSLSTLRRCGSTFIMAALSSGWLVSMMSLTALMDASGAASTLKRRPSSAFTGTIIALAFYDGPAGAGRASMITLIAAPATTSMGSVTRAVRAGGARL